MSNRTPLLTAFVAALMLVAAPASGVTIAEVGVAEETAVRTVLDEASLSYRYQGEVFAFNELTEFAAEGRAMARLFTSDTSDTGVAYAFDSEAQMDRWSVDRGLPTAPDAAHTRELERIRKLRLMFRGIGALASGVSAEEGQFGALARIAGCPRLTYGSRLYDLSNCNSSNSSAQYLGIFRTDAVPYLSTYGFDNKTTSINIQDWTDCIVSLTLYEKPNYSSTGFIKRYVAEPDGTAVNLLSVHNNAVSSVKSICS